MPCCLDPHCNGAAEGRRGVVKGGSDSIEPGKILLTHGTASPTIENLEARPKPVGQSRIPDNADIVVLMVAQGGRQIFVDLHVRAGRPRRPHDTEGIADPVHHRMSLEQKMFVPQIDPPQIA